MFYENDLASYISLANAFYLVNAQYMTVLMKCISFTKGFSSPETSEQHLDYLSAVGLAITFLYPQILFVWNRKA